jgi:prepilin peptidase CpaA
MPLLMKLAPLIVLLGVAAAIDARTRRIPNWLTFGLMIGGLARTAMFGSAGGMTAALLGFVVGAAIPLVLFAISALGGGDVKLLAAVGIWLGPGPVFAVFLVEAMLGLVIVLVQARMEGRTKILLRNSAVIAANFACVSEVGLNHAVETGRACRSVSRPLPYAVPLFFATLIVLAMGIFAGR